MKTINNILLGACLVQIGYSCEDVIDVNLNSSSPSIIIEGKITSEDKPAEVTVSRSVDYFSAGVVPKVSNAKVTITTDNVYTEQLKQYDPGRYLGYQTVGFPGESFKLEVEVDGVTYSAKTTMPMLVVIDTLIVSYSEKTLGSEAGYEVYMNFTDPPAEENFYKIEVYRNGKLFPDEKTIRLRSDKYSDGKQVSVGLNGFQSNGVRFAKNDRILVKLYSMDKMVYEHLKTLNAITESGFGSSSSTPANPITNLSNGALGYFGAFAVNEQYVEIH
jgi:hypothetical protein